MCWLIVWTFTFQLGLCTIYDVYMIYHGLLSCPNPYQDKARRWLNVPRECLNPGRSLLLIPDAFEPFWCKIIALFSENSLFKSTYQLQIFWKIQLLGRGQQGSVKDILGQQNIHPNIYPQKNLAPTAPPRRGKKLISFDFQPFSRVSR